MKLSLILLGFLFASSAIADTLYQANIGGYSNSSPPPTYTTMYGGYYGGASGGNVAYDQFNYPRGSECCSCNSCNQCGTDYFNRAP